MKSTPSASQANKLTQPGKRSMRIFLALALVSLLAVACGDDESQPLPIASGSYAFQRRDAEFPDQRGFPVTVQIDGRQVTVINPIANSIFPSGTIESGTLMRHRKTGQWIIGLGQADREAEGVGDCSGGPATLDFSRMNLWTC